VESSGPLLFAAGHPAIDGVLAALVDRLRACARGRVRAIYLGGSWATGEAVAGSDLDVTVALHGSSSPDEARALVRSCEDLGRDVGLDLTVAGADDLARAGVVWLHEAGRLLAGEAVPIPPLPPDEFRRRIAHAAFTKVIWGRALPARYPVGAPDPADLWLGLLPASGSAAPARHLVVSTNWAANALISFAGGRVVWGKGEAALAAVRAHLDHPWADFVAAVYRRCRSAWGHRVPATEVERAELRTVCEWAVEFHNHFLAAFRDLLVAELAPGMPARGIAAQRLGEVLFPDPSVRAALAAAAAEPPPLGPTAREALRRLESSNGRQSP
jgi:hypothetical protein